MLQFFENGMALYVMAVIFALGTASKMIAAHTYKRLMRQSANFSNTKGGYLKHIKNKYENVCRANEGMKNCSVFIENQINSYRILKIPIQRWESTAIHAALFCFFAGVGTSFLCFWYSFGVRPVVLHFVSGVLFGVALVMIDGMADTTTKRDMLIVFLQDFLENNMSTQIEKGGQAEVRENKKVAVATQKNRMKDDIFMKKRENNQDEEEKSKIEKIRNHDAIRRGIEQIAATRELEEERVRERRKLTPEEEQLLEDIISEYLN